MKNNTLLLILHKVMNQTKESMAYTYKIYMQDSSLSKEQMEEIINDKCHEYRTFLKMLFITGDYEQEHMQLFKYCKNSLKQYKNDLMSS